MEIKLFGDALDDMAHWRRSGNKSIQKKILQLFKDMQAHPFEGLGKPEPLKHNLAANGRDVSMPGIELFMTLLKMRSIFIL